MHLSSSPPRDAFPSAVTSALLISLREGWEEAKVRERGSGDALLSFGFETDLLEEQRDKETHLGDTFKKKIPMAQMRKIPGEGILKPVPSKR